LFFFSLRTLVGLFGGKNEKASFDSISPFVKEQIALGGKTTAYVCRNYVCELPTTDTARMEELLSDKGPP
jgi:uncharacterized protein YyaL (SSP411 family)